MKKVLVLGHRGTLGRVVRRRLTEQNYEVLTVEARLRTPEDVFGLGKLNADLAVNCVGRKKGSLGELYWANGALPALIAATMHPRPVFQASSDGVFRADSGACRWDEPTTAEDPYGLSKRIGEAASVGGNVHIVRASFVGPNGSGDGLWTWVMAQGEAISGYQNQLWNGITSLAWAEYCEALIRCSATPSLYQPTCSRPVSKAELIELILKAEGRSGRVSRENATVPVTRSLVPTVILGELEDLINEQVRWERFGG